jgi:lysophospholipase L1-like esterase
MRNAIFLFGISLTSTFVASGQNIRYDSIRYAREHYDNRVNLFKTETVIKGSVVFLGNSLTEFADWRVLLADSTVINRGVAGDNTFGVLDRLEEVILLQPKKLLIEIGINDISQHFPIALILKNIYRIVSRVNSKSPGTRIYVHSILPTNDSVKNSYPELYNTNAQIKLVDRELQQVAEEKQFTYIDLASQVSDGRGKLDQKYAASDGLHLNKAGYAIWVNLLKKLL